MTRPTFALSGLMLVAFATPAWGQAPAPGIAQPTRPAVSPYLNLLRPGNSPGVNYYGLVRPQMEFRNSIQNLQQQTASNRAGLAVIEDASLPATGHATSFLNTGGYFTSRSGLGSSSLGATTGPRPGPRAPARSTPAPRASQPRTR